MTEDEHTPPRPASSDLLKDFYDRGERAWAEYLRTGVAAPAEAVFTRLDALVEKRRAALLAGIVDADASGRAGPTKAG